jgi:hypothetical protein
LTLLDFAGAVAMDGAAMRWIGTDIGGSANKDRGGVMAVVWGCSGAGPEARGDSGV